MVNNLIHTFIVFLKAYKKKKKTFTSDNAQVLEICVKIDFGNFNFLYMTKYTKKLKCSNSIESIK